MNTFLFLCLLFFSSLKSVEIINHIKGGLGVRDVRPVENTLLMTLTTGGEIGEYKKFLLDLEQRLEVDGCSLSFSGKSGKDLVITFHCEFLNSTTKKIPTLSNTQQLLNDHSIQVIHKEFIRQISKPSWWYDNTKGKERAYRDYWDKIKRKSDDPEREEKERMRKKLYPDVHGEYVEAMAPWGLDRIDTRYGFLDNQYNYNLLAEEIDIYIIDTGINVNHEEFDGGRAQHLVNTVGDGINTDCNGHGTHVASIAGGRRFGVAKGSSIFAVKALDCAGNGDSFTILTGIMAVREYAASRTGRRGVASLSLGGDYSDAINSAVLSLVNDNIVTVVAAGNEQSDACLYSPAFLGQSSAVITVGASNINDARPYYSNYGRCVVLSAPGDGITGANYQSNTSSIVHSGTSMATPHASGVAAIILSQDLGQTPLQVRNVMVSWATPNVITGASSLGGGKNLLYSLVVLGMDPPLTTPTRSPVSQPIPQPFQFNSSAKIAINWNHIVGLVFVYITFMLL